MYINVDLTLQRYTHGLCKKLIEQAIDSPAQWVVKEVNIEKIFKVNAEYEPIIVNFIYYTNRKFGYVRTGDLAHIFYPNDDESLVVIVSLLKKFIKQKYYQSVSIKGQDGNQYISAGYVNLEQKPDVKQDRLF